MGTFTYESQKYRLKNVTVDGNLDLLDDGAILKIGNDDDLQITHSGSAGTITNNPGDLTLDVAGDIVLDSGGNDIDFKVDGTYDNLFVVDVGDDFVEASGSFRVTGPNGHITASGNISASGQVFSNTYYQWEATARCDTDDDSNWQGPTSKGLMSNEDWNFDYGTDYDGTSDNAESRLYMNAGWWIPHGANYSASIKSMDIYVQPNSNITHADDDFFSCSLWYSKASDLAPELNVIDATAGTFVQRHGASVDSSQFKAADEKFFKYNN